MKRYRGLIIYVITIILTIILSVGIEWIIATSDLPAWFKFALLQK